MRPRLADELATQPFDPSNDFARTHEA